MNAKVITIANHKGGVGKTTSTASIGAGLAILGKRVLLIDLDAQQNLSFTLTQNEDPETSVYDSLVKDMPLPIVNVRENLDLVPASLELARAEIDMATKIAREGILKSLLEENLDKYDYVLIDCPPSLGIVTTNALVASDELFIPLTAEALPLKGLTMLDDVVNEVRRRVNPKLEIGAVFALNLEFSTNSAISFTIIFALSSSSSRKEITPLMYTGASSLIFCEYL